MKNSSSERRTKNTQDCQKLKFYQIQINSNINQCFPKQFWCWSWRNGLDYSNIPFFVVYGKSPQGITKSCISLSQVTRAGVKYVLSNTNTNTNTFFSGVSNTNTNTNTPAKIWSNTNTNTNTAHQIQIQIQIHNEAETKLPPFYRWHIEIFCIVRRLFIHSNFTENCFQRTNLQ